MFPQKESTESNPLMGGFGYLEWNNAGCYHPGVDFNSSGAGNADCGTDVLAICKQTLVANVVNTTGYGWHQWWVMEEGPYSGCYLHYCHMMQAFNENVGHTLERGDVLGSVGRSGGWDWCHLHFEVSREKPPHWEYWPKGQALEAVAAQYYDPIIVSHELNTWYEAKGEEMTVEEKAVLTSIQESGYPITEVPELVRACATWSANASSLGSWVEEIGALKARISELESMLSSSGVDPNAKSPEE